METRRGKSFTSGMSTSAASPQAEEEAETRPLPHPLAQAAAPDSPAHTTLAPKLTHVSLRCHHRESVLSVCFSGVSQKSSESFDRK